MSLPPLAQDKVRQYVFRLTIHGHELRRPVADYLRDGIYELRTTSGRVNYRVLDFFHGRAAAILSHGIVKEDAVPAREIELAIRRKQHFESNAAQHMAEVD